MAAMRIGFRTDLKYATYVEKGTAPVAILSSADTNFWRLFGVIESELDEREDTESDEDVDVVVVVVVAAVEADDGGGGCRPWPVPTPSFVDTLAEG